MLSLSQVSLSTVLLPCHPLYLSLNAHIYSDCGTGTCTRIINSIFKLVNFGFYKLAVKNDVISVVRGQDQLNKISPTSQRLLRTLGLGQQQGRKPTLTEPNPAALGNQCKHLHMIQGAFLTVPTQKLHSKTHQKKF